MTGMKKREAELAARRSTAGSRRRRPPMRRRTSSTATSAATRCPIGWPTSRSGLRRSARPRPRWRPKPRPQPRRSARRGPRPRSAALPRSSENRQDARAANTEPDGEAQRNFTNQESRILKTKDGYIQGYNAQAAVDGARQIIVAQTLTSSSSDQAQLAPMLLDGIGPIWGPIPTKYGRRRLLLRRQSSHDQTAAHQGLHRHRKASSTESATANKASRPAR